MSKTIGIRVSEEAARELERRAAAEGVSLSDYCRRAIYDRSSAMQLRLTVEVALEKFEDQLTERLEVLTEEIKQLPTKADVEKAVNFAVGKKKSE